MPVKTVPRAAPKVGAVPKMAMQDESAITRFNAHDGDSSRALLYLVIAAAAGLLIFIFAFPKEPPEGLDTPPETAKIPKEIVQEALKNPSPEEDEPPQKAVPPDTLGAKQAEAPPPSENEMRQEQRSGKLTLQSSPSVDVYDGKTHLGRTPVTVTLTPGTHKLRLTDAKTGINKYKSYQINADQNRTSYVEFRKSTLTVRAPNGATISLNSRVVGEAPMDPIEIYEGKYLLRVSLDGMNWSEWFNAPPGRNIEYKVQLQE